MDAEEQKIAKAGAVFALAGQLVHADISSGARSLTTMTSHAKGVLVEEAVVIAEMLWEKSGMAKAMKKED